MTVEELLKPRYKVIADYPKSDFELNQIIAMTGKSKRFPLSGVDNVEEWETWIDRKDGGHSCYSIKQFEPYPHLFRKLEWWEERTLDEMMSVSYIKVTIYTGYWRVGDIVKVTDYKIDTKNKKLLMYILEYTQQSLPERCIPATLEEYTAFINQIK